MKKLIIIIMLSFPLLTVHSQIKQGDSFLGGSIGLWTKGNTPVLGASFESHISGTTTGTIGIGGLFRYHGFNETYNNGSYRDYNFSSLGFQANYNFTSIGTGEFVPYLGLTLGYNNVSSTYVKNNNVAIDNDSYTSGVWVWGQLGARYFFSPKVAGNLRVGIGNNDFYPLEIGIDFKL
ncbi:MAG TPA: hypothetical protein PKA90_07485 [Ignavibacteria bacterium]|nr:hypothetical protein [Ignavibacteria bacterium]HMR40258.1 hypothetical protein [Ignavibacteria bacterium]